MGFLLCPAHEMKGARLEMVRMQKLFKEVLYKYSYAKVRRLGKHRLVQILYSQFVESGSFQAFAAGDETLGENLETYSEAISEFIADP